jgi:DNA-directed RNA polymerase subunit M/transcription elongation factor TFIIS
MASTTTRPGTTAAAQPAAPAPTPRRRRAGAAPAAPLGSLTQRAHQPADACADCGSHSVTTLSITLTDGTPARFTSCRRCGHRAWEGAEGALSISDVLVRSTKG